MHKALPILVIVTAVASAGAGVVRKGDREKETGDSSRSYLGLPRGRTVGSTPSSPATRRTHCCDPNGRLRAMRARNAASSCFGSGRFTVPNQSADRSTSPPGHQAGASRGNGSA